MILVALGGLVAALVIGLLLRSLWVRAGLNVRQTLAYAGRCGIGDRNRGVDGCTGRLN